MNDGQSSLIRPLSSTINPGHGCLVTPDPESPWR